MELEYLDDFKVESIGDQYIDVYDLEVEDNHNFFGNDILLHNSVYFEFDKIVKQKWSDYSFDEKIDKLNEYCEKIVEPEISKAFEKMNNYIKMYKNKMVMKREIISDRAIWTAKKRYVMNVRDNEGERLKEPKLKVMGIECIKSSTPYLVREKMKEALKLCLNTTNEELIEFIENFQKEFFSQRPQDIFFPRSVNGLKKYYKKDDDFCYVKSTPIHVRGSLIYNNLIRKYNLEKKYHLIQEGEKIKFGYLKEPNITKSNIIAFPEILPHEFKLDDKVDYETQFLKTFIEPLNIVLSSISWNYEKKEDLSDFFS